MGVFSNRGTAAITESYANVDLLDEAIDITGVENIEDGALTRIVAESEANYTILMKTVGICELAAIEEDGEAVYEASDVSGFFGKIKEFFKGILEKIKRVFKNFLVKFDSWTKSGKDFITKYKKQIISAKTTNLKFDGFVYTDTDAKTKVEPGDVQKAAGAVLGNITPEDSSVNFAEVIGTSDDVNTIVTNVKRYFMDVEGKGATAKKQVVDTTINKLDEKYDDFLEELRGAYVSKLAKGAKGKMDAEEYNKELFKGFRNGDDSKDELPDSYIEVNKLMGFVLNYDTAKKTTEGAFNQINKYINSFLSALDKAQNQLLKDTGPDKEGATAENLMNSACVRIVSYAYRATKDNQNIWTIFHNAKMRAMKDEASQAKAILVKLITRKPTNEGADLSDGDFGVTHTTPAGDVFASLSFK